MLKADQKTRQYSWWTKPSSGFTKIIALSLHVFLKEQFDQFFFPPYSGFVSIDHLPVVCESETIFFK